MCGPDTLAVGLARVGQDTQRIVSGTLGELAGVAFGPPLHSLVLVGAMHDLERDLFEHFRWRGEGERYVKPVAREPWDSDSEGEGEGVGEGEGAGAVGVTGAAGR